MQLDGEINQKMHHRNQNEKQNFFFLMTRYIMPLCTIFALME